MINVVALVTARGGSQGVPGKNILPLAGKPLIAWSIEAALASPQVARVIVSTDDEKIASVSRQWGGEVPFLRPAELARANTPHIDVVLHALDWLENSGSILPDYLMLLQPTSPLRTTEDINAAIQLAQDYQPEGVVSVCPARDHPLLVKQINAEGYLSNFMTSSLAYLRRQDLPPAYVLNGSLYLTRPEVLRQQKTFLPTFTRPYVMPEERSFEIDEWMDFHIVRMIMEENPWQAQRSALPEGQLVPVNPALSLRKPA